MEQTKTKKNLSPKEIVIYCCKLFDVSDINWAQQILITKKLLEDYTDTQIIYALDYYKNKGKDIYSMGFLKGRMKDPISMLNAENTAQGSEGSGERNQNRIRNLRSSEYRAEYPEYLFAET